jgi:FMN-dependent oxidoreductase (nitrilotriacetate monooxygenase family)
MAESENVHLAVDLSFYHTDFVWQRAGWRGYDRYLDPGFYEDIARLAQRGVIDLLFFGEAGETPENYGGNHHAAVEWGVRWPKHDMLPMVPLMSRVAPNVGFGLTMSTTYHHPFHVARVFSSLDHITGGRMAWNSVTSGYKNEAANWGHDPILPKDVRYRRAFEHMEVVDKLWSSVEPDVLVHDVETGRFADPAKVHLVHHHGEFFDVRGPLPVLPSPQGRPMVVQAGMSGPGMELAATYADLQFVIRRDLEGMKQHRAILDAALAKQGRSPRELACLFSVRPRIEESKGAADERDRRWMESVPPNAGMIELSNVLGVDFSTLDGRMPLGEVTEAVRAQQGHFGFFEDAVRAEGPDMTVEEFGRRYILNQAMTITGSVTEIVDELEKVHYETGANGGFILEGCADAPGEMRDFVEQIVPELQRRGLSKKEYAGPTLRENMNG